MPSVSVIVPNYNHARYLPRRLKSILDQTYTDFELLILDDCSPDNSRDVIETFASDPRVRVIYNETNSGNTYLQWNKGLALTSGKYVWVAESDDFADPWLLKRLVTMLDSNPRAGLAFCETIIVDEADRELAWYPEHGLAGAYGGAHLDVLSREFVSDGREYIKRFMFPSNTIPNASAVLFRREAIESIGGPVTSMRLCGDWLTYCKILSKWQVAHVPEQLNYFRTHHVNVRSKVRREAIAREWLEVVKCVEQEVGKLPATTRRELNRFVAEVLLGVERADNRVPVSRMPAALKRAFQLAPGLLVPTLRSLARQIMGTVSLVPRLMPPPAQK